MFDKMEFANVLMQAKGDRSLRAYAQISDVSAAHLSRLSRGLIDSPPTPETLKKLATNAQNGVTLKTMMHLCGYYDEPDAGFGHKQNEVVKVLYETQDRWGVRRGDTVDYILTDGQGATWEWVEGGVPKDVYGKLAILPPSKNKRSIVLRGESEVSMFLAEPPLGLRGDYSLIRINDESFDEIQFETQRGEI